jgi:8-oxo-dGTP pyrophosphatase MutT (NUDIX family)
MDLLTQPRGVLVARIRQALEGGIGLAHPFTPSPEASVVLFLLGSSPSGQPVVIFNKRSRRVRQPGDLCFPGGSIAPRLDGLIANLLTLPFMPLARAAKDQKKGLALLLATGLRESFEEMRLNPLKAAYLGRLPTQRLVMFQRDIHPLVCWVDGQQRFFPNWEVEKVIAVPLHTFLKTEGYARYHLEMASRSSPDTAPQALRMLCFCIDSGKDRELLWGATFRMVLAFLDVVFGFQPPGLADLPVVYGRLDESYLGRSAYGKNFS